MAALNGILRDFFLRNQEQLKYRKFLINILTKTENRPTMLLHTTNVLEANRGKLVKIHLEGSLKEKIKPDLKRFISPQEATKLNVLDKWVYDNNIPLVKEDSSLFKLILEYQNFCAYPAEDKVKADEFSMKVRRVTNEQFYQETIKDNFKDEEFHEVVNVVESDKKQYIAEFRATVNELVNEKVFELCILSDKPSERLMTEIDTVNVTGSDIVNVKTPITTTVGRIIVNQLLLVQPFSDTFPFVNKPLILKNGDILKDINKALMEKIISVDNYKLFLDNLYFLGHFCELCSPCLSEKAIVTDANLSKRKAELYKKYAGHLDDPVVISKIEDELIAMDKNHMKGDSAMRFYTPLGGNSFDLWRKKLYIAVGGIEAFDKDTSKYDFIPNSLEEGQTLADLPKYGNESRKGSYQRGHETRNGGALTKFIIRAFHDSRIQEEDCHTNKGISIDFKKYDISKFKGRFIMLNGKWEEITNENINKIPLKTYIMRSPQYCQCTKGGYCAKCTGRIFAELDTKQLTMSVVDISTTFMNAAMKNMHGSKLALHEIKSLDEYIL